VRITCAGPQATANNNAAIPASSLLAVSFLMEKHGKAQIIGC